MIASKVFLLKHWFLANYHWNRMTAILDGTQHTAAHLTQVNPQFAHSRTIYHASINHLSDAGVYRRAIDLIPRNTLAR
jgi:hypothetical protein